MDAVFLDKGFILHSDSSAKRVFQVKDAPRAFVPRLETRLKLEQSTRKMRWNFYVHIDTVYFVFLLPSRFAKTSYNALQALQALQD